MNTFRKICFAMILLACMCVMLTCGNEALPEMIIPTGAQKLAMDLNALFQVNSRSTTKPTATVLDENTVCIYPSAKLTRPIIENNGSITITIPKGVVLDLNWKDNLILSSNANWSMSYYFDGAGTIRAENLASLILDTGARVTIKNTVTLETKCKDAVFIYSGANLTMENESTLYYVNDSINKAETNTYVIFRTEAALILANAETTGGINGNEPVTPITKIPGTPVKLIIQKNVQFSPSTAIALTDVVLNGVLDSSDSKLVTVKGNFVFGNSGRIPNDIGAQIKFSKYARLMTDKVKKEGTGETQKITTESGWSFLTSESIKGYLEEKEITSDLEEKKEGSGRLVFDNESVLAPDADAEDLSGKDAFLFTFN